MSTIPSTIRTIIFDKEKKRAPLAFKNVYLKIASPQEILSWSHGEVTRSETINYRSQKPERDGLCCEKIFGPVKDWQCACGKYKKVRYRGITCDRCGVEVTKSLVRRERMGHINLAAPISHIWFLKSVPSRIGLILNLSIQTLEKVVYFASFIITNVNESLKQNTLKKLEVEFESKKTELKKENHENYKTKFKELTDLYAQAKEEIEKLSEKELISEADYRRLSFKYGHIFEAEIGSEAILKLLSKINLKKLAIELEEEKAKTASSAKFSKIVQRLKLIKNLINNKIKPPWMILAILPILPPDLRPIIQLDGGRFASSDLNELYRRVINRNNRLKKLKSLGAPEVILRNEKRMLQEAVDSLIDNEMRSKKTVTASTGQQRPLKSLSDMLRGKEGRFRQNLLGKRVDYSGRSVIVVGPQLKLHQCGIPKIMAIELFKPFIASKLIEKGIVHNVRSANRLIETAPVEVWDILEEIISSSYVLLNRAPTLHRLSIQAFQPILIEGKAIQVHPLVCPAFNADFDGDQMAVHVLITKKAREEAKNLILSSKNLLKPANGEPIVTPSKDMTWGAYYLTNTQKDKKTPAKVFADSKEAFFAYQNKKIDLQEKIKVRFFQGEKPHETTIGRIIFNSILPKGIYNLNYVIKHKDLEEIIAKCLETYGEEITVDVLDKIKEISLKYLTTSGFSWSMDDLPPLPDKKEIIKEGEEKIDQTELQFKKGLLTVSEREEKNITTWIGVKDKIDKICRHSLDPYGSIFSMLDAGARGSWMQINQMFGMKGIISSPTGRLIELPIKNSFKEGLSVLEYFISTHGSRKGIVDTALRTSSAGYLTRKLIDAAQEVVITEEDCRDKEGLVLTRQESKEIGKSLTARLFGRVALDDIKDPKTKKVIVKANEYITREKVKELGKIDLDSVRIRSVLNCKTQRGLCHKCYGYDLGYNKPVALGAPVGIVAAQSIGEPGTQLTLRTFHTGGVMEKRDITQGLPRVQELLEIRPPKRKAIIAHRPSKIEIFKEGDERFLKLRFQKENEEIYKIEEGSFLKVKDGQDVNQGELLITISVNKKERKILAKNAGKVKIEKNLVKIIFQKEDFETYNITTGYTILVKDGQTVSPGDRLTDGDINLKELLETRGKKITQKYILQELQYVYASQGPNISDKHFEIIIKQMFSRVQIIEKGDSDLLPGEIIPLSLLYEVNEKLKKENKKPAAFKELLLGITRASLSTDSWLAAASFQETSRILVEEAITNRPDRLLGLKENVIIGRLIPAGTGYKK